MQNCALALSLSPLFMFQALGLPVPPTHGHGIPPTLFAGNISYPPRPFGTDWGGGGLYVLYGEYLKQLVHPNISG